MTLAEISLGLAFAAIVATASLALIVPSWRAAGEMRRLESQMTDLAAVRALLAKTVEQAERVALFPTAADARSMTIGKFAMSGPFVGMRFGGASPATIEFNDHRLWFRNADGNQWVILPALDDCSFSLEQGVLRLEFTKGGRAWEIWAAAN